MAKIAGSKSRGMAKFSYDFTQQGGVAGDITLVGTPLPKGAIVWDGCVDIIIAPVGAGGTTAAISTGQAANDLITDAAVAGAPWSSVATVAIVPVGTVAACIKMTADRSPKLVIGTHNLTAGQFDLYIQYFLA